MGWFTKKKTETQKMKEYEFIGVRKEAFFQNPELAYSLQLSLIESNKVFSDNDIKIINERLSKEYPNYDIHNILVAVEFDEDNIINIYDNIKMYSSRLFQLIHVGIIEESFEKLFFINQSDKDSLREKLNEICKSFDKTISNEPITNVVQEFSRKFSEKFGEYNNYLGHLYGFTVNSYEIHENVELNCIRVTQRKHSTMDRFNDLANNLEQQFKIIEINLYRKKELNYLNTEDEERLFFNYFKNGKKEYLNSLITVFKILLELNKDNFEKISYFKSYLESFVDFCQKSKNFSGNVMSSFLVLYANILDNNNHKNDALIWYQKALEINAKAPVKRAIDKLLKELNL